MVTSEVVIKASGLTKRYNGFTAVDHIDFEVCAGECVGFLGPNGAGKTTTVRMIYCFSPVTEGKLLVSGLDVTSKAREIKRVVGVSPQEINLDPDFSVLKNLQVYARYYGIPKQDATERALELLKFFQLEDRKEKAIDELSTGMKRRLIIARALMSQPRILLLDEPTTGLDPQARLLVWEEVRSLRKQGVTIILTTHYMEEAEALCDRVLIIDSGKIIENGVPAELVRRYVGENVLEVEYDENVVQVLRQELPDAQVEVFGDKVRVFVHQPYGVLERVVEKFPNRDMSIRNANLEDVFLRLTGRKLKE